MSDHAVLEVERLSVSIADASPRRRFVRDSPGGVTGLIGSNGVGKTTLLRSVLGLQRIDAGEIRCSGSHSVGEVVRWVTCPKKSSSTPTCQCARATWWRLVSTGDRYGFARRTKEQWALVEQMLENVDASRFAD